MPDKPSVRVYQEFEDKSVSESPELYGLIIGPVYNALTLDDNKDAIFAGEYDKDNGNDFSYPNRSSVGTIKTENTLLFFDLVELEYLDKVKAVGAYDFRLIHGFKNRLKTVAANQGNNLSFRGYINSAGTSFPKSTEFDDRDVQAGDSIEVSDGVNTIKTLVNTFVNEVIKALFGSVDANSQNQGTQAHNIAAPVAGVGNAGDDTVTSQGTYVGNLASGVTTDTYKVKVAIAGADPAEVVTADGGNTGDDTLTVPAATSIFDAIVPDTYTVEVTTAGLPGVAELTVTSIGGDDLTAFSFTAFDTDHDLGTKGLKLRIQDGGDGILILGDKWEVAVTPSDGKLTITTLSGIDDVILRQFPGFGDFFTIGALGLELKFVDGGDTVVTVDDEWDTDVTKAIDVVAPVIPSNAEYTGLKDTTYTIEVTEGGLFGDCEITVRSSGTDSSGPTVVSAADTDTVFGNFGGLMQFPANVQNGLVKGDKWTTEASSEKNGAVKTLVLKKDLPQIIIDGDTPSVGVATADPGNAGDDTFGLSSLTYKEVDCALTKVKTEIYTIEITKAGAVGVAEYTVVSASGLDDQVAAIVTAFNVAHVIGTGGLTGRWTDGGDTNLTLGDKWTIEIEKQTLSASMRIVKADLQVPKYREDIPGQFAWESKETQVEIGSDIKLTDPSWKFGGEALVVEYAKAYVQYTTFEPYVSGVGTIVSNASKADVEAAINTVRKENVLSYAVYKAVQNSSTKPVKYIGLATDDSDGWDSVIALIAKNNEVYHLGVASKDQLVISKFKAHVNALSNETKRKWRRIYTAIEIPTTEDIYKEYTDPNTGDKVDYLATVDDDPNVAGIQYSFVELDPAQDASLISDGVQPGYIFRYNFQTDVNGEVIYQDFVITEVHSEHSMSIAPALSSAVTILSKYEVYKALSKDEKKAYMKDYLEAQSDWRVVSMFPDTFIDEDGDAADSYFMACAVAGLKAGVEPHQGLTKYEVGGVSLTPVSFGVYSEDDLDELADSGAFIVTQDTALDRPYIRHQLTTDLTSELKSELSCGTNADELAYYFGGLLDKYIGKYNIFSTVVDDIRSELWSGIETKKECTNDQIGPQVIDGTIVSIERSTTQRTKLETHLQLTIAGPLNNVDLHLKYIL
jgi:hypothetical protein